jgi:hypothetical protein
VTSFHVAIPTFSIQSNHHAVREFLTCFVFNFSNLPDSSPCQYCFASVSRQRRRGCICSRAALIICVIALHFSPLCSSIFLPILLFLFFLAFKPLSQLQHCLSSTPCLRRCIDPVRLVAKFPTIKVLHLRSALCHEHINRPSAFSGATSLFVMCLRHLLRRQPRNRTVTRRSHLLPVSNALGFM